MYTVGMRDCKNARSLAGRIGACAPLVTQLGSTISSPQHTNIMSNKEAETVVPDFGPVERIVNMNSNPALRAGSFILSTVETLRKSRAMATRARLSYLFIKVIRKHRRKDDSKEGYKICQKFPLLDEGQCLPHSNHKISYTCLVHLGFLAVFVSISGSGGSSSTSKVSARGSLSTASLDSGVRGSVRINFCTATGPL